MPFATQKLGLGLSGGNRAPVYPTTALSSAKAAIADDTGDVNILVIGDSTGNDTTDWVYIFSEWLADQYPTHSVSYRLWNDGSDVYAAEVAMSSGGANTIRIWNASIAGVTPPHFMGSKFDPAIADLPAVDLVIWNHGHNMVVGGTASLQRGTFAAAMEMVREAFPSAPHAMTLQNPRRDDTDYNGVASVISEIAADRQDVTLIDVHSAFIAANKDSSLYTDNIHPNADGQLLWLSVVTDAWEGAGTGEFSNLSAWLDGAGSNILAGAYPINSGGTLQTGWSVIGAGTAISADVTEVDDGASYSTKLVSTAALSGTRASLTAPQIATVAGQVVTLAVRHKVPTGSTSTVGRIGIAWSGGSVTSIAMTAGQGGWRWTIISGVTVPASPVFVHINLYSNTAAAAATAYYDRAILVLGDIPGDVA